MYKIVTVLLWPPLTNNCIVLLQALTLMSDSGSGSKVLKTLLCPPTKYYEKKVSAGLNDFEFDFLVYFTTVTD